MALARHRSLAMTMRYTHVDPGACRQRDAVPSEKGPRELGVDNKKCCPPCVVFGHDVREDPVKESTPGRIRTCNPRFRRPMRYPIAPRARTSEPL